MCSQLWNTVSFPAVSCAPTRCPPGCRTASCPPTCPTSEQTGRVLSGKLPQSSEKFSQPHTTERPQSSGQTFCRVYSQTGWGQIPPTAPALIRSPPVKRKGRDCPFLHPHPGADTKDQSTAWSVRAGKEQARCSFPSNKAGRWPTNAFIFYEVMAATILQWNIRGLWSNIRDFDILVGELQPEVTCLQEIKLEHSPLPKTYQCANYDCYNRVLKRRPEQLPCGGVSIYVKKGLYHKPIQLGTHLQAIAVQVALGWTPVTILSVYTPSSEHLKTQDLSRLLRGLNGHRLITGDFNGHNYSWGSLKNDTRGGAVEGFTDRNNLCILNDGSPTYLKPQAQHSESPTSAIDLSICTPGLALRCTWEVVPDTWQWPLSNLDICAHYSWRHRPWKWSQSLGVLKSWLGAFCRVMFGQNHGWYPPGSIPPHLFCQTLHRCCKRQHPKGNHHPQKFNPWFDEEWRDMLKTRRALDRKVHRGSAPRAQTLMSFRRTEAQARWLFNKKKKRIMDKIHLNYQH